MDTDKQHIMIWCNKLIDNKPESCAKVHSILNGMHIHCMFLRAQHDGNVWHSWCALTESIVDAFNPPCEPYHFNKKIMELI